MRSIFLIGPPGSGKTAVGRKLARALSLPFYDSDAEIEKRTGVDIPLIFEKEGEAAFRRREREAIDALTAMPAIVLATGGGAVILPENRHHLSTRGYVVYLETSLEHQVSRVGHSRHRPLLAAAPDAATRLRELANTRIPLYEEIADIVISTDGRPVYVVAEQILREVVHARSEKS